MTKVYVAKPRAAVAPAQQAPTGRLYSIDADTEAVQLKDKQRERGIKWEVPRENKYSTGLGSEFTFEVNIFHTEKMLPIRGTVVESGSQKVFTDRVGRAILTLKPGISAVVISGEGYVEAGSFAPEAVKFEPIALDVDIDSDSVFTIYSSGQVVPGERRHEVNYSGHGNPYHGQLVGNTEFATFLRENWIGLGLAGLGIGTAYYLGKSSTPDAKED